MKRNSYRDGRVHVCSRMCDTCIFRPGNLMHLNDGRRDEMVDGATRNNTAIICHSTLSGDNAVCRGFFDRHKTPLLMIAERMGIVSVQETEKG